MTIQKGGTMILTVEEIRAAVHRNAAVYGIEKVWLFGSYAKGKADEKSDVNLRLDKGECKGLKMAALACALEEELGKEIDLLNSEILKNEDSERVRSIMEEEILLWG